MLSLKQVTRARVLASPFLFRSDNLASVSSAPPAASSAPYLPTASSVVPAIGAFRERDVVSAFKDWFTSSSNALFDRIYSILNSEDADDLASVRSADSQLSQLGLRLSEAFVLEVLNYGNDVLSCLKFYDWAGRQPGFSHTRSTFYAIFKILSKAKLHGLMLDFLQTYRRIGYGQHRFQFNHTLVMGYALAGKPEVALQVFAKMRFSGSDLNAFGYHVLLNSLVDGGKFDVFEVLLKQMKDRGFEDEVGDSIRMKSLCRQEKLDEAEAYLRELLSRGKSLSGFTMVYIVDALCKKKKFDRARRLIEEVRETGLVQMEKAYGVWIRELVRFRKVDEVLEFLQSKRVMEGYVPDASKYSLLAMRLLRENRLEELYDVLMDMQENDISPNNVTMNAALCFFCKAGMVDVAQELYNMKEACRLSPSHLAHKHLIHTLLGEGNTDEAFEVLRRSVGHGYVPDSKTFSMIGNALIKDRKLDKMKELVVFSLEKKNPITSFLYSRFISFLCRCGRVEDGYFVHTSLEGISEVTNRYTYSSLIHGLSKSKRGDIAARLLIEMQDKGYQPTYHMYRAVIRCLCDTENPENQFFKFLELQLSRCGPHRHIYNFFMDGAGFAGRPDLAGRVFELMQRNGLRPALSSNIRLMQCYLKNNRFSDALWFFTEMRQMRLNKKERLSKKVFNVMIAGLCEGDKVDIALDVFSDLRGCGSIPSMQAYELLVKTLCTNGRYDTVLHVINDLLKVRERRLTSFLGNTLLMRALETPSLYMAWVRLGLLENVSSPATLRQLCQLIGIFSGCIKANIDQLEKMVEECFPFDVWTYNLLLKRLRIEQMEPAYEIFRRMHLKGYKPDRFTYDIMLYGFLKHRMDAEAGYWLKEMLRKGFDPADSTKLLIKSRGHSKYRTAARC